MATTYVHDYIYIAMFRIGLLQMLTHYRYFGVVSSHDASGETSVTVGPTTAHYISLVESVVYTLILMLLLRVTRLFRTAMKTLSVCPAPYIVAAIVIGIIYPLVDTIAVEHITGNHIHGHIFLAKALSHRFSIYSVALIALVIVYAFSEELVWRSVFFDSGKKYMNGLGIAVNSVLFGLWHMSNGVSFDGAIAIAISAVPFAILFYRTKSIIPSVMCHVFYNLTKTYFYGDHDFTIAAIIPTEHKLSLYSWAFFGIVLWRCFVVGIMIIAWMLVRKPGNRHFDDAQVSQKNLETTNDGAIITPGTENQNLKD